MKNLMNFFSQTTKYFMLIVLIVSSFSFLYPDVNEASSPYFRTTQDHVSVYDNQGGSLIQWLICRIKALKQLLPIRY